MSALYLARRHQRLLASLSQKLHPGDTHGMQSKPETLGRAPAGLHAPALGTPARSLAPHTPSRFYDGGPQAAGRTRPGKTSRSCISSLAPAAQDRPRGRSNSWCITDPTGKMRTGTSLRRRHGKSQQPGG